MGIGSWGGGIVLGLVAVLWLAYLIPSWAKRQQYLATERNAIRLQQTLRILAQSAEVPEEVTVEANAKSVADAQRILRSEEAKREAIRRAHEAARQRAVTRELAATAPALRAADSSPVLAARRLRRTRLATTLLLVLGLVGVVAGIAGSAWPIVGAGTVAALGSLLVLGQLSAVSRARARRAAAQAGAGIPVDAPVAQAFQDFAALGGTAVDETASASSDADADARAWTPVPLPRPLYMRGDSARELARSSAVAGAPTTEADADALRAAAAAQLREAQQDALREVARAEAALQAQRDARDAHERSAAEVEADEVADVPAPPAVAPAAPADPAPAAAPASRFARMGYVDEGDLEPVSIDEMLRRRRAV